MLVYPRDPSAKWGALARPQVALQELLPQTLGQSHRVAVKVAIEPFAEDDDGDVPLRIHAVKQTDAGCARAQVELAQGRGMDGEADRIEPHGLEGRPVP